MREAYVAPKRPVAEFTLEAGTRLPDEVIHVLESNQIPYYLAETDSPQPIRLLTSTGIYEGSSIVAILTSPEFS
jgi:hypothetical protein